VLLSLRIVFVMVLLVVSLSGCASRMEVTRSSTSAPQADFDKGKRLVVSHSDEGDWNSEHYWQDVVSQFNRLSYDAVMDVKNDNGRYPYGRYLAIYQLDTDYDSYDHEYTSKQYGLLDAGRSNIKCESDGSATSCSETNYKTFGVTGQTTRSATKTFAFRSFRLWIYDLQRKKSDGSFQQVLYTYAFTDHERCTEGYIYNQLIETALSNLKLGPKSVDEIRIDVSDCPRQ